MEEMRLQKYLAMCNAASRRGAEKIIAEGRVCVNGEVVTEMGTKVAEGDCVTLDGKAVVPEHKKIYIMLNKPVGCLSTVTDHRGRPTVMNYVSDIKERIYPVGRLDMDTEGLLLMTNDGEFTYRVTHPSHGTEKCYEASVLGIADHKAVQMLEGGVMVDGRRTSPAKVQIKAHHSNSTTLLITIHEGRNRQVRKMCAAVGHPVVGLKRLSVGSVHLGNLPLGHWRHLTEKEIKSIIENGEIQ